MAAPADSSSTTATTTAGEDEEALLVKTTMPLPRDIQLVMAISPRSKSSTATTASTASTKTIGELGEDRFFMCFMFVIMPSICIAAAAASTYAILRDDDVVEELISSPGGYSFLAVTNLVYGYMAVLQAAGGHLVLFAPRTPYALWDTFLSRGYEWIGLPVMMISVGVCFLKLIKQTWPLLVAWNYLFGLVVASTIAFWLCLLRTYGGDDGGERRRENSSCGEAVIDGLAYLFGRLLYEFAVRFRAVAVADADAEYTARFLAVADAGMQQLDADVAVV